MMAARRKSSTMTSPRLMPRLLGWLSIADHIDATEWERRYCVLAKEERRLYFMSESENQVSPPDSPSSRITEALDIDNLSAEPSPFKRGGQLTRSFHGLRNSLKRPKNSNKHHSIETKPLVDIIHPKIENSRGFKNDQLKRVQQSFADKRRLGASLDNLDAVMQDTVECTHKSLGAPGTWLDLATPGHLHIEALHQSISPKHSCFRIITENSTLYASCGSEEELQKWIVHLQAFRMPQKIFIKRLDTQLNMWILEAKNFPAKKKFFVQIYLDYFLYAQTCAKSRVDDTLFWGEPFTFVSPPTTKNIIVKVYKDNYSTGKKSSKKDKSVEIGTIMIPLEDIRGHEVEKWYQIKVNPSAQQKILNNTRETPSIRIKGLSQVVSILPLKCYDQFQEFLGSHYSPMCDALEHLISAKCKDEIAQTLIRIFQIGGIAKEFLVEIVTNEVKKIDNENLVFRGNTFATKAVDTYMKMVGEKYLQDTLHNFIVDLIDHKQDCEVDPAKLSSGTNLEHNQQALTDLVRKAWNSILGSDVRFPVIVGIELLSQCSELQSTFHGIRQKFGEEREELCFKLISGSIFLRFFCPAILSPSLFHLCQEYPDEKTARKLKLVAKVIMTLANFTRFGAKEDYMFFMNDFVEQQIPNMKKFIKSISAPVSESSLMNAEVVSCHIDLGRELSIMHGILKEHIHKLSNDSLIQLPNLPKILEDIEKASEDEHPDPLTAPYDTLRNFSQAGTGDPYITDSSSDTGSSASSCCTPTDDQETGPPPLPPARKPSPHHMVNGSIKGIQQQLLNQSQKSVSLPTSSSTSPMPGQSSKNSSQSSNKDVVRSFKKSRKNPASQSLSNQPLDTNPGVHQSFSDVYGGQQPSNLDDAIANVLNSMPHHNNTTELVKENEKLKAKLSKSESKVLKQELELANLRQELLRTEEVKKQLEAEMSLILKTKGDTILGLREHLQEAKDRWVRDQQKMHREVETTLRNHHKMQNEVNHLKSTVEEMQKVIKAKDRLIEAREKQIGCLLEANRTLGNGLDELQSLPKHSSSAEDSEDEILQNVVVNNSCHFQAMHQSDLMQVISSLDKGKFDFS